MRFTHKCFFTIVRHGFYASGSIETGTIACCIVASVASVCIYVAYHVSVYIYHGGIILKMVSTPSSAVIAGTTVSISIVYTSVITYTASPITIMETIVAIIKPPITRSPQITIMRWSYPYTRYPIIIAIVITISPIARNPKISISRTIRLIVIRQFRRGGSHSYRNTYFYTGINC